MPVTRDVALDAVSDLLVRPPRASITFLDGDEVAIVPVRARFVGDQPLVRLPAGGPDLAGREVVVLVDDGPWWFWLRGASFRDSIMVSALVILRRGTPARGKLGGKGADLVGNPLFRAALSFDPALPAVLLGAHYYR